MSENNTAAKEIFLDDGLGRRGCAGTAECRRIVGAGRRMIGNYRRKRSLFIAGTLSELAAIVRPSLQRNLYALAVMDLEDYPDEATLMEAARTATEKRGRTNREVARAVKAGYYLKEFARAQHLPDIVEIHHSKSMRQGTPIRASYLKTVEEMGGAPAQYIQIEEPKCKRHHTRYWGVFRRVDGYAQGDVVTNEQLVAYMAVTRRGDSAWYDGIMGHGDHLRYGVMHLLHFHFVAHLLALKSSDRPRYLIYLHYTTGANDTMGVWKQRALFKPRYLLYVDDRALYLPSDGPMPGAGKGLTLLKATLNQPWPDAIETARQLNVPQPWLRFFHHLWIVERTRSPGLVKRILENGPIPSLEVLRDLGSYTFPLENLDLTKKTAIVQDADALGLDTLLPLQEAGFRQLEIYHANADAVAVLRSIYLDGWTFEHATSDTAFTRVALSGAAALIIDLPAAWVESSLKNDVVRLVAGGLRNLIVCWGENDFARFGYGSEQVRELSARIPEIESTFGRTLSAFFGCHIYRSSIYFRSSNTRDTYWVFLEFNRAN